MCNFFHGFNYFMSHRINIDVANAEMLFSFLEEKYGYRKRIKKNPQRKKQR